MQAASAKAHWLSGFVSNSGQSEEERNPNVNIKVTLPAAARIGLTGKGGKQR